MESLILFRTGRGMAMLCNLGITLAGGLLLVFAGAWIAMQLRPAA
jgi:CrcB protein